MRRIAIAAAAVLLAGCSEEAPQQQPQEEQRAALTPGEYEASWTVAELRSTDNTTPATELTQGQKGTTRACVREGGEIDPALFAEASDECTPSNSFTRGGRISIQLECKRSGATGQVMQSVTGTSTAESFEGEVTTTTYLSGSGDYQMSRSLTGRRVGECPAAAAAKGEAAAT